MGFSPPPDATKNEYGYWILPNGDFAPGQDMSGQMGGATDAQRNAAIGQTQTDPRKGLTYRIVSGQRWYDPPKSGSSDPGGGLIHGRTQWNPQTGAYDTPLDWGKILSMVSVGIITAGAADAALAASPSLAATAPAGASASSTAAAPGFLASAGASPLASTTIGTGMMPTIAGGTGMGGGGGGIFDALKTVYDVYNKAKPIYDTVTGKSSSGPSPASAVGQTAGSIEQQRMNGLIQQAKLQQEQDQLGLNRTNAGVNVGNLNLAQQKQALSAPGTLANQSVRGDILANSQDASFSGLNPKIHMPTMTGGLRPSMMSDSTRALGAQMSRNALADSTSGKYTTMAPLPTIPGATPLPEANAYDKILQGTATGAGFLDALKGVQMPGGVDAGSPQHAEEDTRPPTDQNMGDPGMDPELEAWLKSQQEGVG